MPRDYIKNPITPEEYAQAEKEVNAKEDADHQRGLEEARQRKINNPKLADLRQHLTKPQSPSPAPKAYKVLVDDNFDYTDEERRYEHGTFTSLEEALSAAKMIVDRYLFSVVDSYLFSGHASNMTADELYKSYVSFGPDPFITSNTEEKITFSAWDYAKERCQELYNASLGTLEKAISLATTAHEGQTDKAGAPYISHPLRVMSKFSTDEDRIAAVLHDAVEDCEWMTLDVLRFEGFSETVVEAVDSVTKRDGEDYDAFIRRAAANPIGRRVKLADLEDNCDLSRISNPTDRDYERIEKYRRAIEFIKSLEAVDAGNSTLTPDRAVTTQVKRRDLSNLPPTPEDSDIYKAGFVTGETVESQSE